MIAKLCSGNPLKKLHSIRGAVISVPYGQFKKLAELPEVEWVSPDRQVGGNSDYDVETVGAAQVWNGISTKLNLDSTPNSGSRAVWIAAWSSRWPRAFGCSGATTA